MGHVLVSRLKHSTNCKLGSASRTNWPRRISLGSRASDTPVSVLSERLNHPYQMILGYPVCVANLLRGYYPARVRAQVQENTQGIVGV